MSSIVYDKEVITRLFYDTSVSDFRGRSLAWNFHMSSSCVSDRRLWLVVAASLCVSDT